MDFSSEALRITPPCGAALRYCAGQGADALSSRRLQRPVRIAQQLAREENEIGMTAADGEVRPGPKIIWTLEALPREFPGERVLREIDVQFRHECRLDDPVASRTEAKNGVFHHSVIRVDDGRELVRARSVWR